MHFKFLQFIHLLQKYLCYGVMLQLFCVTTLFAQSRVVTGKVNSSEDNLGLPGTSIIIKGSNVGTVTDADGNYKIDAPSSDAILVFSSIGYATQEILVGDKTTIDVTLPLDVTQLGEVVVVGYGTVKKSDVTGALTRVGEETIRERPVTNVMQALQGKAAGVSISSNIKPGETPAITIRGQRSIQGGNDPLVVVDGIPLYAGTLADVSPNDIASVEILKDASATAIYGSRGANGVILVTTKKGAKGKITVSYNATVSFDSYKSLTDWMNAGEYVDRWRLGLMNAGNYKTATFTNFNTPVVPGYPDPAEDVTKMTTLASDAVAKESVLMGYKWQDDVVGGTVLTRPTTAEEQALGWPAEVPDYDPSRVRDFNWRKAVTRQGITNNHQISISAGTDISRLYMSFNVFNQKGVQRDQDYNRYNALISGDINPNKWLTLGTSINTSLSTQNYGVIPPNGSNTGAKDLYGRATGQFPFAQPRDNNGAFIRNAGGDINNWNPIIDIDQSLNQRRAASIIANMFTELKFTPWLKYRLNVGTQYRDYRNGQWTGPNATNHLNNRPNTAGYSYDQRFSWTAENLLYFDKTIGSDHTIGVTLLQSAQKNRVEGTNTSVSSTIYPTSLWYDLGANTLSTPPSYGSNFSENSLMSYMGRVNYNFKDRYLLTASARYDGASVLAPNHKWAFFPSAALAWKMHEENFMQSITWIDEFKPRVSYGVVGNSSVGAYQTSGPLSRNPYVFGSNAAIGFLPQVPPNPDLHWERTKQWNVGVDFSVIKSRVTGSIEVYEQNTYDLLLDKILPAVSGYVQKTQNIGKTRNKGIEIALSGTAVQAGDFTWSIDVNWTHYKNEIVELINGKQDMLAQRYFIGQPINVYYQLNNAGVWGNSDDEIAEMAKFNANGTNFVPGTVKVVDQLTVDTDGDGIKDATDYKINAEDYVIRGTSNPKWTGGITNTFKFRNWTLSSFIYAKVGQTYFGGYPNYGFQFPNGRVENDVWSPTNPNGRWPMPNTAGNITNATAAMQFNDGSFYAVRNIALSYSFPKAWLSKVSIKDLQLSFQVMNPFIFGGDVVKMGINPDDNTNWGAGGTDNISSANTLTSSPLGGVNNNTILQQSYVFGIRANF
jgi:TonB-linked SusC/RagA family outer membrane protein